MAVLLASSGGPEGGARALGPLALNAAKSMAGHTEPAAGALGLVQLALELGQCFRAPLHHLARPSAHVLSALLASGSGSRPVFVPRQRAFQESGAADAAHTGGVSG